MKAVLFDLDGTMADTAHDLGVAANRMRIDAGLAPLPLDDYRPQASHGARGLLALALAMTPDHPEFERHRNQFLDHYEAALCHHTQWFEGIPELVQSLQERGIAWGIVTNKHSRFAEPLIAQMQPELAAGCIICGDTTPKAKPHPEPLLEGARRLGVKPEECWYVGDAKRDIEAAQAARMRSVIAMYGYVGDETPPDTWGADHTCESIGALHNLLRSQWIT